MQISSGVGPVEVQQFVTLLLTRMERRCAEHGLVVESVETAEASRQKGSTPGLRSATLVVRGDTSTALAGEVGTHELVAPSPARVSASARSRVSRFLRSSRRAVPETASPAATA